MSKQYTDGEDLQKKISAGVNKLADNVAATLGPRGRNALLAKPGVTPVITKDGVTVANFVDFDDPFEDAAAQLLKQVAAETNSLAGDGTTTSTVLAREIYNKSQKYLAAGSSPVELKRGMDKALDIICEKIKSLARPVTTMEDVEHVATISSNGDTAIGKLIASAAEQVGYDGSVTVEEAKSLNTSLDIIEGFKFPGGYFAQAFVTNKKKNTIEYDDTLVLITDYKIENVQGILPILELVAREGRPLVIVAEQVEGQALAALIMNSVRGSMKVAAVKAPFYGQERNNFMHDLSMALGARFVSRESGKKLSEVVLADLGLCKKSEIRKNAAIFVGGNAEWKLIDEKIESLKSEIKQTDDLHDAKMLQERISRLSSGVAVIRVGGATEVEMVEKKHRIEDALEAVASAQAEGIVPGGGTALLTCSDLDVDVENEDQRLGSQIILSSLAAPLRQMAKNAGLSPDLVVQNVKKADTEEGWDFKDNKLVNMVEAGILDPAKVTRIALTNAVSVASTLITTSNAIVEVV